MDQAFPLRFCILQAIKNCMDSGKASLVPRPSFNTFLGGGSGDETMGRAGNEANIIHVHMICCESNDFISVMNNNKALVN